MEYERTEDAQIQAAFAERVGEILLQYERFKVALPAEQQYEATLKIALLHTMLNQCQELLKRLTIPAKAPFGLEGLVEMANRGLDDSPPLLGLTQACILERWPSQKPVSYRDLIDCIRNALSHPLPQGKEGLPRTGFITQRGDSGLVEYFVFTQSPWVGIDGELDQKYQARRENLKATENAKKSITDWTRQRKIVGVELLEQPEGKFLPMRAGRVFAPVTRVRLDVGQLRIFVLALSGYLSEPLRQRLAQPNDEVLA